ncbi:unnamed protein product [Sphenostylis stenocarpa]|uniref:Uncharacterized protein n=1 Tax=Sphenostylis stenocarpa TaxID=92480 RepID=A0AA86SEJ7_9FABA|nr:unnamed protein product [Sphenostylis stenocarpa]
MITSWQRLSFKDEIFNSQRMKIWQISAISRWGIVDDKAPEDRFHAIGWANEPPDAATWQPLDHVVASGFNHRQRRWVPHFSSSTTTTPSTL